jgi:signal transduction histidine kinase
MTWLRRLRHALSHSLRLRLMALFVLLALAMAATFIGGMQYALSIGWRDAARPLVSDYVDKLAADIGSPPQVARAQALVDRLPLRIAITGPQVNWKSHPQQRDRSQRWRDDERWQQQDNLLERTTSDGHRIAFALSVPDWEDRPRLVGWVTLAVLLLLTALAYWRVRGMLRPLDDIRAGALRFGAGNFAQTIPVRHAHQPDELGELAATINTMAADIQQMLDAKRSLLLAISHELRSPLTRARLNTELLPETTELQASRDALLRDLALMRDLVTDLLESERLSTRHAALHCEALDLAVLAHDVVEGLPSPVQQDLQPGLPRLQLDPARMRLLLRNLLDNALRHTPADALPPVLRMAPTAEGGVRLSVRDFGAGVPPEQLPQLAQAFYRPDAARTREDGGVGLGLYLCKLVALAHGGSFDIANAQPGLAITVTLPPPSSQQPT